jgi:hypothetical protein
VSLLFLSALIAAPSARGATPDPTARTEAQDSQIRELVHWAQEQLAALDSRVAAKHTELMEQYRSYKLNEKQSRKLLLELNELQLKTLEVHETVQLRLRRIVSEPQFERLRARIEGALGSRSRPAPGPAGGAGQQKGTRP